MSARVVRTSFAVLALFIMASCAVFWFRLVEPARRHLQFCDRVRVDLESLAKKRPPNVTRKQWENIVAWTLNAHGNCLTFHQNIPQEERDRFVAELERRLQGPVDLTTIDWIWNEIVRLTPGGKHYSDNWRPTTPERLEKFERENWSWGIEVN